MSTLSMNQPKQQRPVRSGGSNTQPRNRRLFVRAIGAAAAMILAASATATPVTVTTATTIGPNDTTIMGVPLSMAEITVRGATLTVNGRHPIQSLAVVTNTTTNQPGIITHTPGFIYDYSNGMETDVVHGMYLIVAGNVTVQGATGVFVGSRITVDSCGYAGSQGPGQGGAASGLSGGGAGYGGAGVDAGGSSQAVLRPGIGGACYGFEPSKAFAPAFLGSGGGNTFNGANPNLNSGGTGGGCVRLEVGGTLTVGGEITARGGNGAAYAGGGSGGSIFLACASFIGGGSLNAGGGAGGGGCCAEPGGGGGGGRIALIYEESTFTGTMSAYGNIGNGRAGAGTIYAKANSDSRGTLTIDNGGNFGETSEIVGPISLNADVLIQNGGRLGPSHRQADFDVTVLGDMMIAANGAVFADARGNPGSTGSGRGGAADGASGGGGGYGGAGTDAVGSSQATLHAGLGGICYGTSPANMFAPTLLGSGGGNTYAGGAPNPDTGGFGGGAIKLNVTGTLTVAANASISARGGNGAAYAGGGSGGSIFLTCGTLAGAGAISASGGDGGGGCCSGTGGGGGGGRIAIIFGSNNFTGSIGAFGGAGSARGGAGSVYMRPNSGSRGTVTIDNNNNFGELTEFPNEVTFDANFVVRKAGRIGPAHGQTNFSLTVLGDMNIDGDSPNGAMGAVFGDGRGFVGSTGPGRGNAADGASGGGGGYGGIGGRGSVNAVGGTTYGDDRLSQMLLGSGGGNTYAGGSPNPDTGGFGGGAIKLNVRGTLTLLGQITARGATGAAYAGAGSGGSVLVMCASLAGTGLISASGGNGAGGCCATTGGGGGGGRVVVLTCNNVVPNVSVAGGTGSQAGQSGTALVGRLLQPLSARTSPCGSATFSVLAPGNNLTYQWYREVTPNSNNFQPLANGSTSSWDGGSPVVGAIVSGATSATLTITADTNNNRRLSTAHAIRYKCFINGSCGTVESNATALNLCIADINCDGAASLQDIFDFLGFWFASDLRSDVNNSASVTLQDVFDFLTAYFAGCQ